MCREKQVVGYLREELGVTRLAVHGESIGGVAAASVARHCQVIRFFSSISICNARLPACLLIFSWYVCLCCPKCKRYLLCSGSWTYRCWLTMLMLLLLLVSWRLAMSPIMLLGSSPVHDWKNPCMKSIFKEMDVWARAALLAIRYCVHDEFWIFTFFPLSRFIRGEIRYFAGGATAWELQLQTWA